MKGPQIYLKFTKDKNGQDLLLDVNGYQVMMEWEKPYMEACVDMLKPKGHVLEVGFGFGYSADQFQKYNIESHTIIECDPNVVERCKEWAKDYDNIKIIKSTWQEALEMDILEVYDTVFIDDHRSVQVKNLGIDQSGHRIKRFFQALTDKKYIKHGSRLSTYHTQEGNKKQLDDLKKHYCTMKSIKNPGKFEFEWERRNYDMPEEQWYHNNKGYGLVVALEFKK